MGKLKMLLADRSRPRYHHAARWASEHGGRVVPENDARKAADAV